MKEFEMNYKLNYDGTGKVSSIQNGNMSIPLADGNTDYQQFLEWNAKQTVPLDLNSTYFPPKTWDEIRAERDRLLAACDWTQVTDAVLTDAEKIAWATYRQKLRDIPQDFTNPDDVVFPEMP